MACGRGCISYQERVWVSDLEIPQQLLTCLALTMPLLNPCNTPQRNVHAIYYTSMDLKAYPFDKQQLLLQMEVPQARMGWSGALVNLIPSTTGTAMFTARTGTDQLSGWSVDKIEMNHYEYNLCQMPLKYANNPSAAADPSPLVPDYLHNLKRQDQTGSCAAVIEALPNPRTSVYYRIALVANVDGRPIAVSGLNVIIHVSRFGAPYIITG